MRHPRPVPRDADDLIERVKDRGFTPSLRDLGALLDLLHTRDRDLGKQVVAALVRLGTAALPSLQGHFDRSTPPARARLCEAIGALAGTGAREWLLERVDDVDGPTRRRAAARLGKLGQEQAGPEATPRLLAAFAGATDPADRRAFAEALGKLGGGEVLAALAEPGPEQQADELSRTRLATARVRIKQRTLREQSSTIELTRALPVETPVLLHVRAGLEELLLRELQGVGAAATAQIVGRGRVRVAWPGPLDTLYAARTFLHLGFPVPVDPALPPAEAAVRALTMPSTTALLRGLTEGPVRYRLDWSASAAHRSDTRAVANQVEATVPWLVNDPSQAPWEVVVTTVERSGQARTFVEIWPKGLRDPRFVYRKATMPASSHPTVAASLALVAGTEAGDVVWDPFVGTGMELIERARLGRFATLFGTDTDAHALVAARANLDAAGFAATLVEHDARTFTPGKAVDLVITNPPFGQRVPVAGGVEALLEAVLDNAVARLSHRGRIAFITPRERATHRVLARHGLVRRQQLAIDVGGFDAHLELWQR